MKKLNRRDFLRVLQNGTYAAAAGYFFPRFFVDAAHAQSLPGVKVVNIFLSGGNDWFLTHERTGNGAFMDTLRSIRPTLAVPVAARRPLGSSEYTIHNRLALFESSYNAGELAVIMGVGIPTANSGSHEEATLDFATGVDNGRSTDNAGWMQKLALQNFTDQFSVIDFRGGTPTTTGGPYRPLSLTDLAGFGYNGTVRGESGFRLATAFSVIDQAAGNAEAVAMQSTYNNIEASVARVASVVSSTTINPAFPNTSIGNQLRDVYRAFVGIPETRAAFTSTGGYDLHAGADPAGQAVLNPQGQSRLLNDLNLALDAFKQNCVNAGIWSRVIVLITSEFGRTNRENGTLGCDHADASVCFCLGGAVRGGHFGAEPTSQDLLSSRNSIDAQVGIVRVYSDIVRAMGFDPVSMFPGQNTAPLGIV